MRRLVGFANALGEGQGRRPCTIPTSYVVQDLRPCYIYSYLHTPPTAAYAAYGGVTNIKGLRPYTPYTALPTLPTLSTLSTLPTGWARWAEWAAAEGLSRIAIIKSRWYAGTGKPPAEIVMVFGQALASESAFSAASAAWSSAISSFLKSVTPAAMSWLYQENSLRMSVV